MNPIYLQKSARRVSISSPHVENLNLMEKYEIEKRLKEEEENGGSGFSRGSAM